MEYNLTTILEQVSDPFFHSRIIFFESVDSTNNVAKQLANDNAPAGTVVIANRQTGGRGRYERKWFSPPDVGIWMSVILHPKLTPAEAVNLPEQIGALILPVLKFYASQANIAIKLPNDILIDGKKVCGILCESAIKGNALEYVVVGIGINVLQEPADFPDDLRDIATSLFIETGRKMERVPLINEILQNIKAAFLSDAKNPIID